MDRFLGTGLARCGPLIRQIQYSAGLNLELSHNRTLIYCIFLPETGYFSTFRRPLKRPIQLFGHVFDEETGEPINGAQLGAFLIVGGQASPLPVTHYDGSYKLPLREGAYVVGTGAPGYVFEWYNNCYERKTANAVSVTVHQENSGIDFYLAKAGSISGHVYSDKGDPISDASVYAFSDIFPGSGANTESNGSFKIEGLPSGSYTVQVTVTGYFSESEHSVVVDAPNNTPGIDFTLKKMPTKIDAKGI